MKKIFLTLTFLLFVLMPIIASAHPGRTDGAGGHYDNSAGEYHYHHGYSAHQHYNGDCPYDSAYAHSHSAILEKDPESDIDWEYYREKAKEKDEEEYSKMKEDAQQRASTTKVSSKKTYKSKIKDLINYFHEHLFIIFLIYILLCVLLSYLKEKIISLIKK